MAIWVCRTGLNGQYEKLFFEKRRICLTRPGFDFDLSKCDKNTILNRIVELNPKVTQQTVVNIWSQMNIFVSKMKSNDIVIIPRKSSPFISVSIIRGEYCFIKNNPFPLNHTREIDLLATDIITTSFPQDIRYSLGAFRTIFGIRQETRLIVELQKMGVKMSEI